MNVGQSVRKSIDDWELGDLEPAMLHACNAVDGTARKAFPTLGNKARFTRLLRGRHWVFGPMGMPGINLEETRFPVKVARPTTQDGLPDFADVIYGIHLALMVMGTNSRLDSDSSQMQQDLRGIRISPLNGVRLG